MFRQHPPPLIKTIFAIRKIHIYNSIKELKNVLLSIKFVSFFIIRNDKLNNLTINWIFVIKLISLVIKSII